MSRMHILKLLAGFRRFQLKNFVGEDSRYARLARGQVPKTLVIGCSDSRVDPALMTSASPGEIFVVRNVANMVPPLENSQSGFHGVSAAIEFAVLHLKVENILVIGHRQCGGIAALMSSDQPKEGFIRQWVSIAEDAKKRVLNKHPEADMDTLCRHCEREAIVDSIRNLRTFPFVADAEKERGLLILGIYFDLEVGELLEYDEKRGEFVHVSIAGVDWPRP